MIAVILGMSMSVINDIQEEFTRDVWYVTEVLHKQYFNSNKLYLLGYNAMSKKRIQEEIDKICFNYFDYYTKEDRIKMLNEELPEEEKLKIF